MVTSVPLEGILGMLGAGRQRRSDRGRPGRLAHGPGVGHPDRRLDAARVPDIRRRSHGVQAEAEVGSAASTGAGREHPIGPGSVAHPVRPGPVGGHAPPDGAGHPRRPPRAAPPHPPRDRRRGEPFGRPSACIAATPRVDSPHRAPRRRGPGLRWRGGSADVAVRHARLCRPDPRRHVPGRPTPREAPGPAETSPGAMGGADGPPRLTRRPASGAPRGRLEPGGGPRVRSGSMAPVRPPTTPLPCPAQRERPRAHRPARSGAVARSARPTPVRGIEAGISPQADGSPPITSSGDFTPSASANSSRPRP